jgi:NADH:ubiquinone oxidoreductase subunit 6 (subunit J)
MLALYGRPHTWLWLLTFHVISAFILVGAAITVAIFSIAALRQTDTGRVTELRRLALRTTLIVAIPAFIGAHLFGQILAGKEFPKGTKTPGWLDTGFVVTDAFGVFGIVVLGLLQWWVLRRAKAGTIGGWQAKVATWLSPITMAALFVVLFVMAGKPS